MSLTHSFQTSVYACPLDREGKTAYVRGWHVRTSRRPLLLVHDLLEDTSHYREFAEKIAATGTSFYGYDLRGHGHSGKEASRLLTFNALVQDLLQVAAWVRHREQGNAPVVLGQGFGALIALAFARRYPRYCHGLIFSAPSFYLRHPLTIVERSVLSGLATCLPTKKFPIGITHRFATERAQYRQSGRSFTRMSHRFAAEVFHILNKIPNWLEAIRNFPHLTLIPQNDALVTYDSCRELLKNNFGSVLNLEYQGHYPLTETEASQSVAVQMIAEWLETLPPSQCSLPSVSDEESAEAAISQNSHLVTGMMMGGRSKVH